MNAKEIIRAVLDLLDKAEQPATLSVDYEDNEPGEQTSRFRQILAMLQNDSPMADRAWSNTPHEVVSTVDAVTTDAGGGINGPKHPADIRIKDPRGFE